MSIRVSRINPMLFSDCRLPKQTSLNLRRKTLVLKNVEIISAPPEAHTLGEAVELLKTKGVFLLGSQVFRDLLADEGFLRETAIWKDSRLTPQSFVVFGGIEVTFEDNWKQVAGYPAIGKLSEVLPPRPIMFTTEQVIASPSHFYFAAVKEV